MTAKHTPGPWYRSTSGRYIRYDMPPLTGANVCDLAVFGGPTTEADANARLITAAPDLLSALTRLLVGVTGESTEDCEHYDGITADAIEEAQQAIAKAEGRP